MGLKMGIKTDIKKLEGELGEFTRNIDVGLHSIVERLHNLYIEHDKLASRVRDLEDKLAKSNIIV